LSSDRLWKNYRLLACFLDFDPGGLAVVKLKKSPGLLLEVNFDD
jgi:hypothetical protein